jgi:hypothetical protein
MAASFAFIRAARCAHLTLSAQQKFMKKNAALRN